MNIQPDTFDDVDLAFNAFSGYFTYLSLDLLFVI